VPEWPSHFKKEISDMNLDIHPLALRSAGRRAGLLLLSVVFGASSARAQMHDIIISPCNNLDTTFAVAKGQAVTAAMEPTISATTDGQIFWKLVKGAGCTDVSPNVYQCAGMTVTSFDKNTAQPQTSQVKISGTGASVAASGSFTLTATSVADTSKTCDGHFTLHTTDTGGGWGDPHMTTVDGVHYDFQGAGDFVALRSDTFEVQTRQRAVPTATVPGPSEYTGLPVCVAIYSAVAARIGSNKVSLQSKLDGPPDPNSLQLWVNGKMITLDPRDERGYPLRVGGSNDPSVQLEGRILKVGDAYEFDAAGGTQLVATPAYWSSQQTWYLNLSVFQTSATQGIWGALAAGSWLPALPDPAVPGGPVIGGRPMAPEARYKDLYETFGEAWRVTNTTPSLFQYAPGTGPATFAVPADWPRPVQQSCPVEGRTPATPTTPEIAAQACSGITDPAQKANCTFDVTVTGNTGFAQTYATAQAFKPHGAGWQPEVPGGQGTTPPQNGWPWWWWILLLILVLIIIAVLILKKKTP
jgi:hypothetical protein